MNSPQPAATRSLPAILVAVLLVAACGSHPSRPQWYWENSSLAGVPSNQYEARYRGQAAQCQAYAANLANSTYPQQQQQAPTSYQTEYSGSVGGKSYYGSATTTPVQTGGMVDGPLAGYMRGERERARQQTLSDGFDGCMAQNGWYKVAATPQATPQDRKFEAMLDRQNLGQGQACVNPNQCAYKLTCDNTKHVCVPY
jgi:hypothetical protein